MAEVISPVWCINNMLSNRALTHTKQNLCLRGSSDLNWKILSAGPAFCDWGLGSWFGVHPLHSTPGGKCRRGVHQLHYTTPQLHSEPGGSVLQGYIKSTPGGKSRTGVHQQHHSTSPLHSKRKVQGPRVRLPLCAQYLSEGQGCKSGKNENESHTALTFYISLWSLVYAWPQMPQ